MPIYEYRCKKCGSHFERRQTVSEEPLKVCEHCEGDLEKQWSLSGFAFKGEGWYVTDYAGKSGKTAEAGNKEKTAPTESTTTTENASKPKSDTTAKKD